jgi:hypothetical protein
MAWIGDDKMILDTNELRSVARIDSGSNYYLVVVYNGERFEQIFLYGTAAADQQARDRMFEHVRRVLHPITESESTQHTTVL